MEFYCCAGSNAGSIKYTNQDDFVVNDIVKGFDAAHFCCRMKLPQGDSWNLVAVSDGVTNSFDGAIAAEVCMNTLRNTYINGRFNMIDDGCDMEDLFRELLEDARIGLCDRLGEDSEYRESAATVSIAVFNANTIYHYSIGDSPIRLLRDSNYIRLSKEQCEGDMLTEYFSNKRIGNGHYGETAFNTGDILYLSSDGIEKAIGNEKEIQLIEEEILKSGNPVNALLQEALEQKCRDNVTAIVVSFE